MIPRATRIFVLHATAGHGVAFDGLALTAKELLGEDPQSGALFSFVGRRANRLKVLW